MPRFLEIDSQFFGEEGDPLSGGKLYFYESGTSTDKPTYADEGLTILNPQPLIVDAAGVPLNVFFEGNAKVSLFDADDNLVRTMDPVTGYLSGAAGSTYWEFDTTPKVANFTAETGKFHFVDSATAAATITMTLPASPSIGDRVGVAVSGVNINYHLIVFSAAENINNSSSPYTTMTGPSPIKGISLIYLNVTSGWVIYDNLTDPPPL